MILRRRPAGNSAGGAQQLGGIGGSGAFVKNSTQLQSKMVSSAGLGVMAGIQDAKKAGGNLMDKPLHMAVPPVAARLAPPTTPISPAMQMPGVPQNQTAQTAEHLQVECSFILR